MTSEEIQAQTPAMISYVYMLGTMYSVLAKCGVPDESACKIILAFMHPPQPKQPTPVFLGGKAWEA